MGILEDWLSDVFRQIEKRTVGWDGFEIKDRINVVGDGPVGRLIREQFGFGLDPDHPLGMLCGLDDELNWRKAPDYSYELRYLALTTRIDPNWEGQIRAIVSLMFRGWRIETIPERLNKVLDEYGKMYDQASVDHVFIYTDDNWDDDSFPGDVEFREPHTYMLLFFELPPLPFDETQSALFASMDKGEGTMLDMIRAVEALTT